MVRFNVSDVVCKMDVSYITDEYLYWKLIKTNGGLNYLEVKSIINRYKKAKIIFTIYSGQ